MINDLVRKVETTKIPPQIPLELDEFVFGEWYNVNEDLAKEILL